MRSHGVVLLSGGLDSAVLLMLLKSSRVGTPVTTLSIDYGQRHKKELRAARKLAAIAGSNHFEVDLSSVGVLLKGSSQTDRAIEVPHGHYEAESMKQTVVPARNLMMLSVASALAVSERAGFVAYAAHAGDHAIYPDCRPEFVRALNGALMESDWSPVQVIAPFLGMSKANIVTLGVQLGTFFDLTWSCYEGRELHCGKCGTCVERKEAFKEAEVCDPTQYEQEG